ncbi:hypothetical protein BDD43_3589 [Mucilaginibacter gracilis]|uniref:Uncharacterized protein n=1 Tax=Mucilaginibacter gracilis TaxID=423350 RepID=A0A495J461_9SPHI|nr:hypothetical protein [Mucilaginibacter gracilis]RKR83382.1 hypothetical protein BDD43_3589 [Mucilaginibacter gracilis]
MRYNNVVLGNAPLNPAVQVEAGAPGKLEVYIKGTNEKIADTAITVKKNETSAFRVAYIPELGIKGWLNTKPVGEDSAALVFFNKIGDFYTAHPSVDLYIFVLDYTTFQRVETGIVIHNFEKTGLSAPVVLPYYHDRASYQTYVYSVKFKDNATGQFITYPPRNRDYFNFDIGVERGTHIVSLTSAAGIIDVQGIDL